MAIEDRIKALEDESKVLKNVIQATLLDIQKEILTHFYAPEHAERGSTAGNSGWQREGSARAPWEGGTGPGKDNEEIIGTMVESRGEPKNRPVATSPEHDHVCLQDKEVWSTVAKLLIWLSESVSELGRERTAKAIKMYGAYGYISPEMQKVLMALIAFSREETLPERFSLRHLLEKLAELSNILSVGGQPVNLNHILALVEELERPK